MPHEDFEPYTKIKLRWYFPVGLLSVIAFFLRFGTICNLIEQTSFWPCSFHLSVSDLQSHFFFSSMIWRIVKETFVNIRYRTQIKSYFNWSTKPNDHESRRSPLAWKCGFLFLKFWFDTMEIDSEAVCHCTIAWKAKLSECIHGNLISFALHLRKTNVTRQLIPMNWFRVNSAHATRIEFKLSQKWRSVLKFHSALWVWLQLRNKLLFQKWFGVCQFRRTNGAYFIDWNLKRRNLCVIHTCLNKYRRGLV